MTSLHASIDPTTGLMNVQADEFVHIPSLMQILDDVPNIDPAIKHCIQDALGRAWAHTTYQDLPFGTK